MFKHSCIKQEDGYYEIVVSFEANGQPIYLIRAVKTSKGTYEPTIRCAVTGYMLHCFPAVTGFETALYKAVTHLDTMHHAVMHQLHDYIAD